MCLAIPGKILTILEEENLGLRRGTVAFGNIRREVSLDYTPEAVVGDYILVHVGFAVTVVHPDDARRTFAELPAFAQGTDGPALMQQESEDG